MFFAASRTAVLHARPCTARLAACRQMACRSRSTIRAATAAPSDQPKATGYTYVPDIEEQRAPHRDEHLSAAKEWGKSGKLILAGAHTDPIDSAVFVFKGASIEEIEGFVAKDAYVVNGLVTDSVIRPLAAVVAP